VRAFPTPWRLATEYFFLRKIAPRSRALNAFYGAGFRHDEVREIDFAKAAGFLLRRAAFDDVGPFDEEFFLFSEETDWCYRLREAGWKSYFHPGAEIVHVGGATWRAESATLFTEQVRGHLRFLAKHRGRKTADRARRVLLAGLRLRSLVFRGERGDVYRNAANWLRHTR
jgi:N-acetylglucosaminyl-diphospho-decaprenol L-rhamnosyltransferase